MLKQYLFASARPYTGGARSCASTAISFCNPFRIFLNTTGAWIIPPPSFHTGAVAGDDETTIYNGRTRCAKDAESSTGTDITLGLNPSDIICSIGLERGFVDP